jgi:uncharacterized protein (TIGR03435 family)
MIVARSAFVLAAIVCSSRAADDVFEAVSIKTAKPAQRGKGLVTDPGRMKMMNLSLSDMVQAGYGVQAFQIMPKDLPDARYEIVATAPNHPSRVLDGSYEKMIQAMLADRFALKAHRESKVMQVYVLEIAKGGPKLKKSDQPGLSTRSSPGHVTATGATALDICTYLSRRIALPVIDQSGLKGLYDFELNWIPGQGEGSTEPPDPNRPPVDPGAGPSLFTALQEQLGLKLTNRKAPVPMIVVDHWTNATEN